MEEFTGQRTTPRGRSFEAAAYGNDANEIELFALDKAREVFGGNVRLEVVRNYEVSTSTNHGEVAEGKAYYASIRINVVE